MKKFIAIVLAAVMLTTIAPLTAFAETTGPSSYSDTGFYVAEVTFREYSAFTVFDGFNAHNDVLEGAYYDLKTNTLTIEDLKMPDGLLYVVCMGDDFKINVKGNCELGNIVVDGFEYETSLNITGSGTLYVKGKEYGEQYGIEFYETDNGVLNVSDTVTLKIDAVENAVAFFNSTKNDASGLMKVGESSYDKFEKTNHVEKESIRKNVFIEDPYIVPDEKLGYIITCDTDPDGVYTAERLYNDDVTTTVSKLKYISRYQAYVYDTSFTPLSFTEEELKNSGFHYVLSPQPEKLEYLSELEYIGYNAYQVYSENDPDGIYAAEYDFGGSYYSDDIKGYIVSRLVYDEKNNIYKKDESFTPVKFTTEEFDDSEYSFLYEIEEDYDTLEAFEGDPSDYSDYYTDSYRVIYRKSDPDGLYISADMYGSQSEGYGFIIKKVFYDEDGDFYYFNSDTKADNVNTFKVNIDEVLEGREFSFVIESVETKKLINYIDKDFDFKRWLNEGTKITDPWDKNTVFVYDKFEDFFGEETYDVYELKFNEDLGYYVEVNCETYSKDEFNSIGYTIDNYTEQPVEFIDRALAEQNEYDLYEDKNGKQYLVNFDHDVFDFSEDKFELIDGEKYYYVTLNESVDYYDLEPVYNEKPVGTGFDYYSTEKELYFEGSGIDPDLRTKCGDVNLDGKVNGQDAAILARYVSDWAGYDKEIKSMDAADLNRDGKVNGQDAAILSRYVSSWTGYDKYIIAI